MSTREAYGLALAHWGESHDFYVLDADLAKATQTIQFAQKFPGRFVDMGIAEGNLMAFAAGLSTCGVPVFASTFAIFAAGRACEQVRNSIAYAKCNVKIGATHGGVLIGPDGGSHQAIEDIAIMRALPNMTVLCPSDAVQTKACVKAALEHDGPVYMRFGRFATPDIYSQDKPFDFQIGNGYLLREGDGVTLAAIGDMVSKSLAAADILKEEGISASVVDMASVKPLDLELLLSCAKNTGCFVTAEDHNVMGGLGGAVSEALAKHYPCPVEMVGIQDVFGRSGEPSQLAKHYGIDVEHIVAAARKAVLRKNS